jgi:xylose isomerase
MFGRLLDRYATDGYGPAVSFTDAIRVAASVGGIESLDLNYPF